MLRRLHRLDRAILVALVPLWVVCFTLSVRSILNAAGSNSMRVTLWQAADEYPEIVSFAPFIAVAASGVRTGDRVIRVGSTDMRGANGLQFSLRFLAEAWDHERVPVTVERDGRRIEAAVPPVPFSIFRPFVVISPIFITFGIAILLKAPRSLVARSTFQVFLGGAFVTAGFFNGPGWTPWLSITAFSAALVMAGPLMIHWLLVFPYGVRPQSPWLRFLPLPLTFVGISMLAVILGIPFSSRYAEPIASLTQVAMYASGGALLLRRYRRSDPVAKRQLKWSFYGLYLAVLPPAIGFAWVTLHPEDWEPMMLLTASLGLVPAFVYLALYRYDVFDVDRLLSATASYNVVVIVLAGVWLFVAPQVGEAASAWLDLPGSAGQLAVSVGLVALIVPAQRRLKPRLEARLFKDQHALEAGLEALCGELSKASDAKGLLRLVGEALHARIRPESTVIYGRDGDHYAALLVEGRGVSADLPADGAVAATLRERNGPLCVDGELAGSGERARDPFAHAALEVLNAAIVLPIVGADGESTTFVSLGPKRSGDLYTSTEVHLLRAVADRAALELRRFDEREFREQSHAMQEAMRRYVPGAIADHIERGDNLDASERDVSVVFVDLRGYTALAEGSQAQAIFSTVNRYTQTVSEIVKDAGGTVVEFNGDGMMAVFGAPAPIPAKERAAVEAVRRVAREVEALDHEGTALRVGIGVATGPAYVGNIQAADRLIWSAIGNTTNLAARLQSLTRELDVAVLIDASTYGALGEDRRHFRRHEQIAIRGRSERADVFALARDARGAPGIQ